MKNFILFFSICCLLAFAVQSCDNAATDNTPPAVAKIVRVNTPPQYAPQFASEKVAESLSYDNFSVAEKDSIALSVTVSTREQGQSLFSWAAFNWVGLVTILLFILQIVVNLTPTDKDDNVFNLFKRLANAIIPSNKRGGGTF